MSDTIEALEKIPHVPSREQIDRLQKVMVQMPQADGMQTEHFFVPGMYCRRLFRKAGTVIVGKVHKTNHFFLCASGEIIAWSDKGMRHLKPGDVIECKPGTKRVTYALTDAVGITVHKTDKTDIQEIEDELVEFDPDSMFGPGNVPKAIPEAEKPVLIEAVEAVEAVEQAKDE